MRSATLGLKPFLEELAGRLEGLDRDELGQVVLAHAEGLPAGQRAAFLEIFPPRRASARHRRVPPAAPAIDPEEAAQLLSDIDAFVETVRTGGYFQGWGWDHELREERAFGDESWVLEMDGLFEVAGGAFLDGALEFARDAYGKLLQAFSLDQEVGTFCGDRAAAEMVETDVGEAKARYLRALYETAPAAQRPQRLLEALEELDGIGPEASLQAVVDTRREPLPGLDAFLPRWVERLAAVPPEAYGFAREARRLLAEAAALHRGAEGLADLARRPGPDQAQAYLDWVDHLAGAERVAEAVAAAREGLGAVTGPAEDRARLAERLAGLAGAQGDPAGALDARRQAWRAAPSVARLLALAGACPAAQLSAVLDGEAVLLAAPPAGPGSRGAAAGEGPDRTACALLLAAGRVSQATAGLRAAAALGWGFPGHPGPVVVPYLLVAGSGRTAPPAEKGSRLAELFAGLDAPDWASGLGPEAWRDRTGGTAGGGPSLTGLLTRSLERLRLAPDERRRLLQQAREVVEERVTAVVAGQHRGAYQRVAELAVACAEAMALGAGTDAGNGFIAAWHARHPRHSAFRAELDRATGASPFLSVPPRRR